MTRPDKRFLRTKLITDISLMSPNLKKAEDEAILENVLATKEYRNARKILAYISMPHEIDTHFLLNKILADGKILALPLCLPERQMEARIVESLDDLRENIYRIFEPDKTSELLPKEDIDLAIVPCVAATANGYRLGHGGGYYDCYFAEYLPPALVMCRSRCLLQSFPQEAHDIRIPIVVTEKEIFR